MTQAAVAAAPPAGPLAGLRREAGRLRRDAPGYAGTALLLAAFAVPTLVAHGLDARTIDGVGVWAKPLKFQLALGVYCLTLAFYARFVPRRVRDGRGWRAFTALVIAAVLIEAAWVAGAAFLGERAHYNFTHALLAPAYPVMGLLATVLTAATAQYAWAMHRHTHLSPAALKGGLVLGLGLTLPLTLATAFYLSAGAGHHVVAGVAEGVIRGSGGVDAGGLALFGWSRGDGDLRVAHFFATHALHGVPLLALALASLGWKGRGAARAAALAWTSLVGFAFVEALAGYPFLGGLG